MKAKAECKACGGIQDATFDANSNPVYECLCCYTVSPRKVYQTAKKTAKAAEQDEISNLIKELLES